MDIVVGIALTLGGLNAGFMLGRVFERMEFHRKGYRIPKGGEDD